MSEHKESRIFRCVVCETAQITESHIEIIDQNAPAEGMGCNFSDYKDHAVAGGVLFADRPEIPWRDLVHEEIVRNFFGRYAKEESLPVGGICTGCLKNAAVKALLPRIRGLKIK